ncbi:hypothetical protein IGI04_012647 [Brassica rapa subsp. trilocularis]|uniref:Uncharacterized protein n=1 Tax=Brassica rapa subsp. trilocularis TaxID=1813537 RepID=A0ABQ7N791_BRACM|nr:hypothetical protein IGI04_012647 [Brassica rapa subsp. trilocularis]
MLDLDLKFGKGLAKNGKAQKLALQHSLEAGEEVNLVEKCPQLKLQQQRTNHIGPLLRLLWKTGNSSTGTVEKCFKLLLWKIAIPNGFSAQHIDSVVRWGEEGTFQHSSFLAGGANVAA